MSNQKNPKTTKPAKTPKTRPGVQVVLRVPAEVKALLSKTAHDLRVSMNAAATERIATGKWPQKRGD